MRHATRAHKGSPVPAALREEIEAALAEVGEAGRALADAEAAHAPLAARRAAHARLRRAFGEADRRLRTATALAKQHSRWEWMHWRRRLSDNSTANQHFVFRELDSSCLRPTCAIRALDTGMSGPAIGDLLHGEAASPGAVPAYGVDLEGYCLRHDADCSRDAR